MGEIFKCGYCFGGSAWNGATAYVIGNTIVHGGVYYNCILGHTNQEPPNATFWRDLSPYGGAGGLNSPYYYTLVLKNVEPLIDGTHKLILRPIQVLYNSATKKVRYDAASKKVQTLPKDGYVKCDWQKLADLGPYPRRSTFFHVDLWWGGGPPPEETDIGAWDTLTSYYRFQPENPCVCSGINVANERPWGGTGSWRPGWYPAWDGNDY